MSSALIEQRAATSQPGSTPLAPIDKCPPNVLALLPPKQQIIDRCKEHWNDPARPDDTEFPLAESIELPLAEDITVSIKFGPPSMVNMHDAYTQDILHDIFKEHPTVRVPPVWQAFREDYWTYVITPHIKMYSTDPSQLMMTPGPEECADAVVAIIKAEVPGSLQAQAPGAVGGGLLCLNFFRDAVANKKYANLDELAEDVTKLSYWRVPVKFDQHEMRFYFVGVKPEKFCQIGGLTFVLDFHMAGLAPIEFQIVDMMVERRKEFKMIARHVLKKLGREHLIRKEEKYKALKEDNRLWAVKVACYKS